MASVSPPIPRAPDSRTPEQALWEARLATEWFFSRIDFKYLQEVKEGMPGYGKLRGLPPGEWETMWQSEWDKRTLLRPLEAGNATSRANTLLRASENTL